MSSEDVKNLTVGAALAQFLGSASGETRSKLISLLGAADRFGLADEKASKVLDGTHRSQSRLNREKTRNTRNLKALKSYMIQQPPTPSLQISRPFA